MIKYIASQGMIKEIEIIGETKFFYRINNKCLGIIKRLKNNYKLYDSFEEAKQHLVNTRQHGVKRAIGNWEKANQLTEKDVVKTTHIKESNQ